VYASHVADRNVTPHATCMHIACGERRTCGGLERRRAPVLHLGPEGYSSSGRLCGKHRHGGRGCASLFSSGSGNGPGGKVFVLILLLWLPLSRLCKAPTAASRPLLSLVLGCSCLFSGRMRPPGCQAARAPGFGLRPGSPRALGQGDATRYQLTAPKTH
jgi:hypothetical protein